MKRLITVFLLLALLSFCACAQSPTYINTATTTTNFFIVDQGFAMVDIRYMGYAEQTTGASVSIEIERLDGDVWHSVVSETYFSEGYYDTDQYTYRVDRLGTYRLTATYLVSGKDGTVDTVVARREYTISEGITCPRGGEIAFCNYEPVSDCTKPLVCKRCGESPKDTKDAVHIMGSPVVDRDEKYHYKQCLHTTVLGLKCTVYGQEKHEYADNTCLVCGYIRHHASMEAEKKN